MGEEPKDILREIGVSEEFLETTEDLAPKLLEEARDERVRLSEERVGHAGPRRPENGFPAAKRPLDPTLEAGDLLRPATADEIAAESDHRQNDEVLDKRPTPSTEPADPDDPTEHVYDLGYMSLSLEQQEAIEDAYREHRAAKEEIDPLGDMYLKTTVNPRVQAVLAARTPETLRECATAAAQVIRHEVEEAFAALERGGL